MSWLRSIVTLLRADAAWEIPEAAMRASYGLGPVYLSIIPTEPTLHVKSVSIIRPV